jgi:peptidoglycan/LPS O-acetylase OafA/YrhL
MIILISAVAAFFAWSYLIQQGADFCARYRSKKKWLPTCAFWGTSIVAMVLCSMGDTYTSSWLFGAALVVMGFPLGIAARARHYAIRDHD